jgi:hypothetical protein
MKKNYEFIFFFVILFLVSLNGYSQTALRNMSPPEQIEGLTIYPNPVSNNKPFIYITSKNNLSKTVDVFNVLGKRIFSVALIGKELNISMLSTGVYILKITENKVSETRKLVIK